MKGYKGDVFKESKNLFEINIRRSGFHPSFVFIRKS